MLQTFPGKLQLWFMSTGIKAAIGGAVVAAALLAWEHQSPWGLGRKLETAREDLTIARADLRQANADKKAVVAETWKWDAAYKRLAAARSADAAASAAALAARADEQARQCRAAYQSGVTAGRALGQRGSDDTIPNPSPDPGGEPRPGGLRDDFADAWRSGAFRPGSDD